MKMAQSYREFLTYIMDCDIYPVLDSILVNLTASDVGALLDALGIRGRFKYTERYLNPLRDIEPSMSVMKTIVDRSSTVLILGDGAPMLMDRILRSEAFWSSPRHIAGPADVWILAIPAGARAALDSARRTVGSYVTEMDPYARYSHDIAFQGIMHMGVLRQISVRHSTVSDIGPIEGRTAPVHLGSSLRDEGNTCVWTLPLRIPTPFMQLTMEVNGVGVCTNWETMYRGHLWSRRWGDFPYINTAAGQHDILYTSRRYEEHDGPCVCIRLTSRMGEGNYICVSSKML